MKLTVWQLGVGVLAVAGLWLGVRLTTRWIEATSESTLSSSAKRHPAPPAASPKRSAASGEHLARSLTRIEQRLGALEARLEALGPAVPSGRGAVPDLAAQEAQEITDARAAHSQEVRALVEDERASARSLFDSAVLEGRIGPVELDAFHQKLELLSPDEGQALLLELHRSIQDGKVSLRPH